MSALEIKVLNMWTNTRVQRLCKSKIENQIYMNFDDDFQSKSDETIVCITANDYPGFPISQVPSFLEMASSRAAPTLGSTRGGGHDDGS